MTRPICVCLALLGLTAAVIAQTPPSAEQYQDALNQLKAAQDRKNQLDTENQKLRKDLADTEKKLTDATEHGTMLESRTYYLREHYGAWQQFLDQNPAVRTMWLAFFANANATDRAVDLLGDGRWPFSIDG